MCPKFFSDKLVVHGRISRPRVRVHGACLKSRKMMMFFSSRKWQSMTRCMYIRAKSDDSPQDACRSEPWRRQRAAMICCHFWPPCMVALFCCWQINNGFVDSYFISQLIYIFMILVNPIRTRPIFFSIMFFISSH